MGIKAVGWAASDASGNLSPMSFTRRHTEENDVTIKILYCGICHSDLHFIKNEWGHTIYPVIPGHEIVGIATEVGSKVQKFKVGDKVGVGCMVDSCGSCNSCSRGFENYCPKVTWTYGSPYRGSVTFGGYSDKVVVKEDFVVHIPDGIPLDKTAPLLCAGITVYTPMKYHGLNEPGKHIGVVGLGGLGHVAVKFAKALGLKVTVISTSPSKEKEAVERLGADSFLVSRDPEKMRAATGTLDGIIDTVSAPHPVVSLLSLLKAHGKMIMVGLPDKPLEVPPFALVGGGKVLGGSCIGGMTDTQEMLDFAAKHNVTADIEVISMDYVNKAIERLAKGDVRYRFVIDVANTLNVF